MSEWEHSRARAIRAGYVIAKVSCSATRSRRDETLRIVHPRSDKPIFVELRFTDTGQNCLIPIKTEYFTTAPATNEST